MNACPSVGLFIRSSDICLSQLASNSNNMTYFHHQLDIVRYLISSIQTSSLSRVVRDFQQLEYLVLLQTNASCYLRQTLVGIIPRLMHNIDVKEFLLMLKKGLAKGPELVRCKSQDSGPRFMHKSARRVPWLYLLAEKELNLCRVLFGDIGKDRFIKGLEHFGREGAHIVEVELNLRSVHSQHGCFKVDVWVARQILYSVRTTWEVSHRECTYCVDRFWRDIRGVGLASELRSECHLYQKSLDRGLNI